MLDCFKSRDGKGVEFAVKEGLRIEELISGQKDDCIRFQLKDSSETLRPKIEIDYDWKKEEELEMKHQEERLSVGMSL